MTVDDLTAALADRYRIDRELGAGGMATVYLADDLRHHRKVALKVMRPELAAVIGADRFLTEITTTANLQHPHILPLFDSGAVKGTVFYVMPFVEGESLRDRLDREKQLPVEQAVRIATEVAGALQYAHQHGIIHRDIKPENILLHGGHALVADFGIALAAARTSDTRMTETGMSLGTPTYMSPEQAMGERTLDARTDIYALGCVLYETLVGDPPHTGSTAQAVVAKVLTERPASIRAQRNRVPQHVEDAVLTALEKLPADRFATAADFAQALGGRATLPPLVRTRTMLTRGLTDRQVALALVLTAVAAGGAGWLTRGVKTTAPPAGPIRFATSLGRPGADRPFLSISNDGRRILQPVFDSTGAQQLVIRDLGTNTLAPVPGTQNATSGEFSPAGDWIAFVANGRLRKVPLQGGPPTTLVDGMRVENGGLAWGADGYIIFSGRNTGLWRVPADGGTPEQLTRVDTARKEFGHWSAAVLPGGNAVIYTNYATRPRVEAYDVKSKRTKVLVDGAVFGRFAPCGHLLYARDAAVFAIEFDPDRLRTRGAAVPVQDDVVWESNNGLAGYAISPNGTFVYLRESDWHVPRTMMWRDRSGSEQPVMSQAGAFAEPRLSPDGRWIALTSIDPKLDLFLYDLQRRVLTQLTRAPAAAFNAVWLSDSRHLVYTFEDPVYQLHQISIDGSVPDRPLLRSPYDKFATSVSPDGKLLLFYEVSATETLMLANADGTGPVKPVADSKLAQRLAVFSPDGRWIAYSEHREDGADIYVRSASGNAGRRLVSSGGGMQPRWTRDGREIVYLGRTAMMSVPVDPATGNVGAPTPLFSVAELVRDHEGFTHSYDVTADGARFLVFKRMERAGVQPMVVVLNWRVQ